MAEDFFYWSAIHHRESPNEKKKIYLTTQVLVFYVENLRNLIPILVY